MTLTEYLTELERLAKAAPPGPWTTFADEDTFGIYHLAEHIDLRDGEPEDNASFISALNPDTALKLIELVEVMREALNYIAEGEDVFAEAEQQAAKAALQRAEEIIKE